MQARHTLRHALFATISLSLSACGIFSARPTGPELPDDPGFYALLGGEDDYWRLDGSRRWETATWPQRSELRPYVSFVVYDAAVGLTATPVEQMLSLRKVAWVRSEIDREGNILPVAGSTWVEPDLEALSIPVTYSLVEGRRDAVHMVPSRPLEPGLYTLEMKDAGTVKSARFGIRWSSVDKARYSALHCVDRYRNGKVSYLPCTKQGEAMTQLLADGLQVFLVEPESRTIDGRPTLVVKGVVVNTANRARSVPRLEGVILGRDGQSLKTWRFETGISELEPGQSFSFRTKLERPPQGTAKVTVSVPGVVEAGLQ